MATLRVFLSLALFLISSQLLLSGHVSSASADHVLLEEGYVVTTVIDGHKLGINPYSVLPAMHGSSNLIVLDSVGSAFYSASLPISEDVEIKRLSGDGAAGYVDGQLTSARFNQPRSFTVDLKGNIYVADRRNYAIRKITASGVRTIAGGYSKSTGRADGPGRNASFSSDFELSFIPESCSLLISDHGNQLIRQILLKEEDCGKKNDGSSFAIGVASILALGVCLSVLLGLVAGFAIRHYIFPHEGTSSFPFRGTWRHPLINLDKRAQEATSCFPFCRRWSHCLINLDKLARTHCSGIRNGVARSHLFQLSGKLIPLSVSHLSLMSQMCNVQKPTTQRKESPSLLDSDNTNNYYISQSRCSQLYDDQLRGLTTSEGKLNSWNIGNEDQGKTLSDPKDKLGDMILASTAAFEGTNGTAVQLKGCSSSGSFSGLFKRR